MGSDPGTEAVLVPPAVDDETADDVDTTDEAEAELAEAELATVELVLAGAAPLDAV